MKLQTYTNYIEITKSLCACALKGVEKVEVEWSETESWNVESMKATLNCLTTFVVLTLGDIQNFERMEGLSNTP